MTKMKTTQTITLTFNLQSRLLLTKNDSAYINGAIAETLFDFLREEKANVFDYKIEEGLSEVEDTEVTEDTELKFVISFDLVVDGETILGSYGNYCWTTESGAIELEEIKPVTSELTDIKGIGKYINVRTIVFSISEPVENLDEVFE